MDEVQVSKTFKLLWLAWSFGLIGIDNGILGPSLLDLRSLIHVKMYQMNPIFILTGIGFICGCILVGFLSSRINLNLLLAMSLSLGAAVNICIPLTRSMSMMATLFSIQGLTKGLVDVGCLILCVRLFPNRQKWQMQFVTVAASLTAFLIPFIVVPFQSQHLHEPIEPHIIFHHQQNESYDVDHHQQQLASTTSTTTVEHSRIQYAYLISALVIVPSIIAFFYYYIQGGCRLQGKDGDYDDMNEPIVEQKYTWEKKWKMLVLLFLFHIPIFGIAIAYSNLLTTYGLATDLSLTKADMAFMTSLMWGSFLVGRILTTCFSKILDMGTLLTLNFVGLLLFVTLLVIQLHIRNESLLWIGTSGFGLFQSSFLPSVISWAGGFLRVDALVLTISLVASGIGEMTIPFISGVLFNSIGPESLMYMVFGMCSLEFAIFLMMAFLNNHYQKKYLI